MRSELDLVEHILQFGIGENVVAAGYGHSQAVQGSAGNAAGQHAVAHRIQDIEKLLAMRQALGTAIRGIAHILQRQDGIEAGNRTRAGNERGMRFGGVGNRKAAAAGGGGAFAPYGAGANAAGAFDFHGRMSHCDTSASPIMVKEGLGAPLWREKARQDWHGA